MSATTFAWLGLISPLVGSLVIALSFRRLPGRSAGWIATGALALSFGFAVATLLSLLSLPAEERHLASTLWDYAAAAGIEIEMGIFIDPLSTYMFLIVSGVSTMIHLYSVSYMASDRGIARYFSYLNFFVFSMLLLILAGNFALLIVGWAFVGFASYALVSFWYRRHTATTAGMKAFVVNVVGDVGLVLAAFLIVGEVGSLDYGAVFSAAEGAWTVNEGEIVAICLLLCVGAFAKSAQMPLHTWLPDAMEGPTPVSSLIHAATMVTAGVYLIARAHPLFVLAPTAADIAAFVGLATLIFAATVALVVTDLKRIIAYSTISQIGYMIVGVSIGAYIGGMFHLMTHAFFKALLFMAAGSVIGAMAGAQNIDKMHGFRKAIPFTCLLLAIGALSLAAFPPTAGFFSKDEILVYAATRGGMYWAFAIGGYFAAFLTAFYAFRITFRVVTGPPCEEASELERGHLAHAEPSNPGTGEKEDTDVGFPGPGHYIADREWPMKIAMSVLGFGALFAGFLQIPGVTEVIDHFLEPTFEDSPLFAIHPSTGAEWKGLAIGTLLSSAGIALAYYLYVLKPGTTTKLRERFERTHRFLIHKWYFDEVQDALVYRPALAVGRFCSKIVERFVVDGIVNGTVGIVRGASGIVRSAQSGYVRSYALLVVAGFTCLGLYFLVVSS
ncbi:MAG: NADH-quinone oxidoreductase subunit L [Solirubrobacterales bacterium]